MKILVLGAGVLGSYLAHVLHCGGSDVTLLARGKRLEELRNKGLVIRHYLQFRTTKDNIGLTESFGKSDAYDIVFVLLRRNQLDSLLPRLCENEGSSLYVIVGNNVNAPETQRYIDEHSKTKKNVVFAFQGTGGRRENGRVISFHWGLSSHKGRMMSGSLAGGDSCRPLLEKAFSGTHFHFNYTEKMDEWLKSHAAFILPIALACYYTNGNLKRIAGDKKFLNLMIDAIDDAYRILEACGYSVEPKENAEYVRDKRQKCYRMFKVLCATPLGRLACCDHAMAAKDEMRCLYDGFLTFKKRAGISTPALDELEKYMPKREDIYAEK
jgi:2-dehydropantoate 2-reductase